MNLLTFWSSTATVLSWIMVLLGAASVIAGIYIARLDAIIDWETPKWRKNTKWQIVKKSLFGVFVISEGILGIGLGTYLLWVGKFPGFPLGAILIISAVIIGSVLYLCLRWWFTRRLKRIKPGVVSRLR